MRYNMQITFGIIAYILTQVPVLVIISGQTFTLPSLRSGSA